MTIRDTFCDKCGERVTLPEHDTLCFECKLVGRGNAARRSRDNQEPIPAGQEERIAKMEKLAAEGKPLKERTGK